MGLTTCTLQSGKFTGLIYGEMEGPPFYTEDNSMPPEVRSCSSRARLHLTEPALPREKGGRRSTALPRVPSTDGSLSLGKSPSLPPPPTAPLLSLLCHSLPASSLPALSVPSPAILGTNVMHHSFPYAPA